MDKEKLTSLFVSRIEACEQSQQGKHSGNEYEGSFYEMSQKLMKEIFQGSLGEIPESRHEKKAQH